MSTLQDTSLNADLAAAIGDVVRARGNANANAGNYGSFNSSFDANLAGRIAPIVLSSLRTLAQQQQQSGQPGFAQNFGQPQNGGQHQQHSGQQPQQQSGYQTQGGQPFAQQGYQTQQGLQQQQQAYQQQNSGQGQQLSARGTLAAVVTPIVAQALTRYQPAQTATNGQNGQNGYNGYNASRPLDRDWLESITGVVAEVTPAVVDALKTFGNQSGAQNNVNAANLAAAAQRGSFDDLTSVVAATVPVVVNALRDYQPQRAQGTQQRNASDDAFDVARVAAPIAIAAL